MFMALITQQPPIKNAKITRTIGVELLPLEKAPEVYGPGHYTGGAFDNIEDAVGWALDQGIPPQYIVVVELGDGEYGIYVISSQDRT